VVQRGSRWTFRSEAVRVSSEMKVVGILTDREIAVSGGGGGSRLATIS